jgi:hypothetical protein
MLEVAGFSQAGVGGNSRREQDGDEDTCGLVLGLCWAPVQPQEAGHLEKPGDRGR